MEPLLEPFEYITEIPDKVDELIEQATRTRGHKEKNALLKQAGELAGAYQRHCEAGGNFTKQFNRIL